MSGLYACGFIIETAHDDLLGVSLDVSPLAYLVTAGTFLLDLVRFLVSWLYETSAWLSLVAVGAAIVGAAFRTRWVRERYNSIKPDTPSRDHLRRVVQRWVPKRWRHAVAACIVWGLLVAKLVYFDAPVFAFSDLLFQRLRPSEPPSFAMDLGGVFRQHTNAIWNDLLCSHFACGQETKEDHQRQARNRFLLDLLATATLTVAVIVLFSDKRPAVDENWVELLGRDLTMLFILATLVAALALLPYVYGKMLYPTTVSYARLDLMAPPGSPMGSLKGYILSESSVSLKVFAPFSEGNASWSVHELQRSQIQTVKTDEKKDVLELQISRFFGGD